MAGRPAIAALLVAGLAVGAAATALAQDAPPAGDPVHGKTVYARCAGCHVLTGPGFSGPALAGVVGRKAGTVAGFSFSPALAASGIVWTDQTLDAYLAAPAKDVAGTTMFFSLPDAKDRADVIAYMKTLAAPGG